MSWLVIAGRDGGRLLYVSLDKLEKWELNDKQYAKRFDDRAQADDVAKLLNGITVTEHWDVQ